MSEILVGGQVTKVAWKSFLSAARRAANSQGPTMLHPRCTAHTRGEEMELEFRLSDGRVAWEAISVLDGYLNVEGVYYLGYFFRRYLV